eukprot:640661-Pelagomonas_calceolata.AAC.6
MCAIDTPGGSCEVCAAWVFLAHFPAAAPSPCFAGCLFAHELNCMAACWLTSLIAWLPTIGRMRWSTCVLVTDGRDNKADK